MYLNSFNKKYIYWNVNGITTMTDLKKKKQKPKKKPTQRLLHILIISESE